MSTPEQRLAVVIEDDADIRNLLRTILVQSGFEPILTSNGADGIEAVRVHEPILTTLDVSMPGMDGFAVAKRLREFSSSYIVMLTGQTDEIDIIQGLDAGADDYLVKPFRPRELRARIESLMRRPRQVARQDAPVDAVVSPLDQPLSQAAPTAPGRPVPRAEAVPAVPYQGAAQPPPAPAPQPAAAPYVVPTPQPAYQSVPSHRPADPAEYARAGTPSPGEVRHGVLEWRGLVVDPATRIATVNGAAVDLTRSEFDLLATLVGSGRRVRSKADLVLTLRGEGYVTTYYVNDADKRAVEVHIANLRRKIGDSTTAPRWIETVRGVGYRMTAD